MATIEVTRLARDELREPIETRQLPPDIRERVSRTLLTLEEFPRAGKQLSGIWRDCRALIGPWSWLSDRSRLTPLSIRAGTKWVLI